MPLVPVTAWSDNELRDSAERRWTTLAAARPDLAPALELQRRLLALVLDLVRGLDEGRLPRLSLPPKYLAAKLARGVPVLVGEPIPLPVPLLAPALVRLCDALAEGGAGDSAVHIRASLDSGSIDPAALLTASLARNQVAIRGGATHRGLAPDLVWLVGELAVGPFVNVLQRTVFEPRDPALAAALDGWNGGYCPACGSWPALAEVVDGHRTLRCSFCAAAWEPTAYACIYCGETGAPFVTAAPGEARKDRRVEVCSTCGGYLKMIDRPELSPFPLVAISDIETTDLDVDAMEHGYGRPPLRDFSAKPPR